MLSGMLPNRKQGNASHWKEKRKKRHHQAMIKKSFEVKIFLKILNLTWYVQQNELIPIVMSIKWSAFDFHMVSKVFVFSHFSLFFLLWVVNLCFTIVWVFLFCFVTYILPVVHAYHGYQLKYVILSFQVERWSKSNVFAAWRISRGIGCIHELWKE